MAAAAAFQDPNNHDITNPQRYNDRDEAELRDLFGLWVPEDDTPIFTPFASGVNEGIVENRGVLPLLPEVVPEDVFNPFNLPPDDGRDVAEPTIRPLENERDNDSPERFNGTPENNDSGCLGDCCLWFFC